MHESEHTASLEALNSRNGKAASTLVWDAPVRVVHWSMVVLLAISWWSAENSQMTIHVWSGYILLGVLVFRLYWGFAGSTTARFMHFVTGPRTVLRYLSSLRLSNGKSARPWFGHNPLGGWSVVVLLSLLLTQVILGLFTIDVDGLHSGPLAFFIDYGAGRQVGSLHESLFDILLVFVALHILAVFTYLLWKRQNLIGPMLSGRASAVDSGASNSPASAMRFLVGVAIAITVVWFVVDGVFRLV